MEENTITFPMGKYKNQEIFRCSDIEYLKWYQEKISSHPGVRRAVFDRINELTKK